MSFQGDPNQPPQSPTPPPPGGQAGAQPSGYPAPPGDQPGAYPAQPAYGGPPARGPVGTPISVGMGILLAIVTLGIYVIYWNYKVFQEMKEYSGEGIGGGIALVIALFAGIVNPFIFGSEIEKIYRSEGQEPPVKAVTGCWVLLPLIGGIIWYVKAQTALNDLWVAHGAQPA